MRTNAMLVAVVALTGCATQFTGAPKVQNGPAGCQASCDQWGMQLVGMVKMGEYSDGCICQRGTDATASAPSDGASATSSDASGAERGSAMGSAAVTGVYLQMQAAAAAAAAQQSAASRQTGE
jgi:hypothetical protein